MLHGFVSKRYPVQRTYRCCRVGLVDGEFVINPDVQEQEASKLSLTVAGTKDAILMVEAGAVRFRNTLS